MEKWLKSLPENVSQGFAGPTTKLRGSLPQLDSMAIVSVILALETQLGFEFPDEQLDGAIFETVGTLLECINSILHQGR